MKFISSIPFLSQDAQPIREFLFSIRSLQEDVSSSNAPTPLVAPISITEYPATCAIHHDLFLLPATQPNPEDRFVSILKNFICSLHAQAFASKTADGALKKPLDALLGETFLATIARDNDEQSATTVICEQVSNSPSVTASFIANEKYGISSQGYLSQHTSFSPRTEITIKQYGHSITFLKAYNEHYMATFPDLQIRGLLTGNRYPQFSGPCQIVSSNGHIAKLAFGEKYSSSSFWATKSEAVENFSATICHESDPHEPLFKIHGRWDNTIIFENTVTGRTEEFDIRSVPRSITATKPTEDQGPKETRRLWADVQAHLKEGDWRAAAEQRKRVVLDHERRIGDSWRSEFFAPVKQCEVLASVFTKSLTPKELNRDLTAGVWRLSAAYQSQIGHRPSRRNSVS